MMTIFPLSASEYTESIYRAFVDGRMEDWETLIPEMDRSFRRSGNADLLAELLTLEYGYIGFLVEEKNEDKMKEYLDQAKDHADELARFEKFESPAYSLKGALFGHQININPGLTMFLGPKSMRNIEKGVRLDEQSPVGWIELGNAIRDMPAFVGGSPEKSLEHFEKGITLLEQQGQTRENWYYLNALIRLARTYRMAGYEEESRTTYRKILRIAPECTWIRGEL